MGKKNGKMFCSVNVSRPQTIPTQCPGDHKAPGWARMDCNYETVYILCFSRTSQAPQVNGKSKRPKQGLLSSGTTPGFLGLPRRRAGDFSPYERSEPGWASTAALSTAGPGRGMNWFTEWGSWLLATQMKHVSL